jgi:hypothetical protein
MRRIDQTQARTANSQLDVIAVKQPDGFSYALSIDQGPIKAPQICNCVLPVLRSDFRVAPGNHRRIRVNYHFALRVAPQTRHFAIQFDSSSLFRVTLFEFQVDWRPHGRPGRLRWDKYSRRRGPQIGGGGIVDCFQAPHLTPHRRSIFRG